MFTDIDPAGNYINYIPHLNKLKITPQLVHILKDAKAFLNLKPIDETDNFEVDGGIDRHILDETRIIMPFKVENALNVVDLVQPEDSAAVFVVLITKHSLR